MTDIFDWERLTAERNRAEALRHEQQRQALAALLISRSEDAAAAIVAISAWRIDVLDTFGTGSYRGVLEVPPAQFDLVTGEVREALDRDAAVLVGDGYDRLDVELRLTDVTPGWDVTLLEWMREEHRDGGTSAARVAPLEFPEGSDAR
jgi:hypothetical protein